ncbi:very-short-patch-repair endonuclease [Sphingomonas jinjuensis]|uniref:Very-short-patch-repair endonuclease n=1 Tax=Sphingomonas jinjuensis TaxID=535907 RepID=A0A840FPG8_9SPHN|nr:DUF559 domain-containing protein [Sphingomonas jinjuensis]MBB4155175.1 very-short-patch-repair endonuclease [Sphingomonas jinjuensis]
MRLYANQPIGAVPRARRLRRDAPEPERRLLQGLREAFPDLKWRHRAPIGPFYADILCFSERLVVEVDGDTHAASVDTDTQREAFMRNEGFRTLRFTNADVMENLEGVVDTISLSLRERSDGSSVPPARAEQRGALFTRHWARSPKASGKGEDSQITKKGSAA